MDRPITTLFMLMSVDGKISTGATDQLDVDKDFPKIAGVCEGLHQYYEIEQTTDLWSLNTGRVQEKMGVNTKPLPSKTPVSFVLITTNASHPAFKVQENNLHIICQNQLSLPDALAKLKAEFGCERITIQSGGTLNSLFLREKLFDYIDIVVAPVLIGGKDTLTLIDGKSLMSENELNQLRALKLEDCPDLSNLPILAEALGVTVDELLRGEINDSTEKDSESIHKSIKKAELTPAQKKERAIIILAMCIGATLGILAYNYGWLG